MNTLQKHLKSLSVCCGESFEWAAQFNGRNARQQAWDACKNGYWMMHYLMEDHDLEDIINVLNAIWKEKEEVRRSDPHVFRGLRGVYADIIRKHIPKVPK